MAQRVRLAFQLVEEVVNVGRDVAVGIGDDGAVADLIVPVASRAACLRCKYVWLLNCIGLQQ